MFPIRIANCAVIAIALLFSLNRPSWGEMLLAEFTYTAPQPVIAPASFVFGVGNSGLGADNFRNWIETVPTFPHASYADAATVAAIDRILTTNTRHFSVSFGLSNGPYEPERTGPTESFRVDAAFDGAYTERGLTATRHAPPIGSTNALQWYALTAIERSATATVQTIRIYGVAAPEPSAWLLAVLGGLPLVSTSRLCSACGHCHRE